MTDEDKGLNKLLKENKSRQGADGVVEDGNLLK